VAARAVALVHRLPWPPHSGVDLRNWQNVRALADEGGVAVLGLGRETAAPAHPGIEAWRASADRSLEAPPESLPAEMLRLLRDPAGHPSDRWFSEVVVAELRALVAEVEPDVVVLAHVFLHRYIPAVRELGCRVVLDAHNLEGPLQEELAGGRGDPLSTTFAKRASAIEAAAFESVDQVWVCSRADARRAAEVYPSAAPVAVVPNTIDVPRYERDGPPANEAAVVYPGAFAYPPNQLAAARLVDEIFPALAQSRPDAKLSLVGSEPTPAMQAAADRDPRIEVTGAVPDVLPFLHKASAMAIPLREGGGTRFKALEAFAAELPVVSTAKGVEGLDVVAGEHYLRAETTAEFVESLTALLEDEHLCATLVAGALERVRERYSYQAARRCVVATLGV
jgi:glycosyltransferase involved in cell wall biosynthesis